MPRRENKNIKGVCACIKVEGMETKKKEIIVKYTSTVVELSQKERHNVCVKVKKVKHQI